MFCPNCGKEIQDDFNFCPHCGQSLKDQLGDTKPRARIEVVEKNIDLRHLEIYLAVGSRSNEDEAWQRVSQIVFDEISHTQKEGLELIEQNIGPNLLVYEDAGNTIKGMRINFKIGTTGNINLYAGKLVCARLHFRKKI